MSGATITFIYERTAQAGKLDELTSIYGQVRGSRGPGDGVDSTFTHPDKDLAMIRISLVLALLFAFTTPAAAQLPVGATAPDFTLQDTAGTSHTLSDYANEVVVLFFVGWG